jgi:type I restriction enzyme S subunit
MIDATRAPLVALKDFCEFAGGGRLKLNKSDYVVDGFPAFSAAGQDGFVSVAEFHQPGIVVSSIGARCGKAFLAKGSWTSLANTYCVLPDCTVADPDFLWWNLNNERSWIRSGTAQPFIKPSDIKARRVRLPPLTEQRRIVDILDRAASIRRLRQQAEDTTRLIIPALFNKMFGDPATNPMGWPVATLGELGTLERGRSRHRPRNDPALLGGPYPLVQTGEVTAAEWFITDHKATYSEMGLAQSRLWPKGTLCITIAANIANSGLLSFDACFPDSVVAFQPRSRVTTFYAKACLDFLREGIDMVAPKLAQKNINLEILSQVPFPVPPLDLQETFGAQVMAILRIQNRMSDAGVAAEDIAKALAMRLLA